MNYQIKVTGEGTKEQILEALQSLIETMTNEVPNNRVFFMWEDETLCTELTTQDEDVPDFEYSDLSSDWHTGEFDKNTAYEVGIEQTRNDPENFELRIWEDGNGIAYEYQYDNKQDAEKDMMLFNTAIAICIN